MSSKRRRFDETFKKRAVQLSYAEDRTVKGTAESLGITPDMLHRWRKKYTPAGEKTKMASQAEELVKLQRRIAQLEEENDLLKKSVSLLREKPEKVSTTECYEFIEAHSEHAVAKWAEVLQISPSGFYDWRRGRKERLKRFKEYQDRVLKTFEEGKGTYGVDRICGVIREHGFTASYDKVKQICEQNGLKSIHNRRKQRSLTNSKKSRGNQYVNLTKDLDIDNPFQVLSSDISYIRTREGFDYLCQIRDVKTNVVLAANQSERITQDLVLKTIKAAESRWSIPKGAIFHSDRGGQYTAKSVMKLVADKGWKQSFSRVGKPGDNAWSESFFANLKKEIVHWRVYNTREEARQAVFEYIEVFYNRKRAQKRLGYLSPIQYLYNCLMTQLATVA